MKTFNIDYVSKFKFCVVASALMMIAFGTLFFTKGLNYGVDFRGGAEIQVRFGADVTMEQVRDALQGTTIPVSSVQTIGEGQREYLLKVQTDEGDLNKVSTEVEQKLNAAFGDQNTTIVKNDIVGPKAGAQLRTSGFQAMAWALLAIMIYLSLRFDFKYAPGAIAALAHDVLFIVGAFILTGREFSLQTVAALLAIIGYSVNDTVVIYDRVRELETAMPHASMKDVINRAVNETMSRTILTAFTVFIVTVVMWLMGGSAIEDFFFALTIGTVVGAYSTVFIASPITIWLDRFQKDKSALTSAPKAG